MPPDKYAAQFQEAFRLVVENCLSEVMFLFGEIAADNTIAGEVTFDPRTLPELFADMSGTVFAAKNDLEERNYIDAYMRLIAVLAHGLYGMMTMRAQYSERIFDQIRERAGNANDG